MALIDSKDRAEILEKARKLHFQAQYDPLASDEQRSIEYWVLYSTELKMLEGEKNPYNDPYRVALDTLGIRYFMMMPESQRHDALDMFMHDFLDNVYLHPLNKLNRWLGYIQGCMIERGHTTVQAERDFSRPLLRPLDYPND